MKRWKINSGIALMLFLLIIGLIYYDRVNKSDVKSNNNVWNLIDNLDSNLVCVNGRIDSTDYPYGYNVGVIEDEIVNKAILVTPGTLIDISGVEITEKASLKISYTIHPWVASASDGANLNISVESTEKKKSFVYDVKNDELQIQTILLDEFVGCNDLHIKIYVTNIDGKNEECDWVILQNCEIDGVFEENTKRTLKKDYIKSATYFADEWPINFWNSEMDNMEADFRQIRSDGFDSIILCIPWREFQPEILPIAYNEYAFRQLDKVMKAAEAEGLDVYVRIGYFWDYYDDVQNVISDRYYRLMGDQTVQEAWFDYINKMYTVLSSYENFQEGFLTWEDFWGNLGVCDETDEKRRIEKASFIGYQRYVEENYTLREYNERYKTSYTEFNNIPIPKRNETAMESMYAFYDIFLNDLLDKSQALFPNLSMEVRMDWDVFYKKDGSMDYYKHTNTFSCMNADFTTTMYGIPMGFENIGEKVGYTEAIEKTEFILQQFKQNNNDKPVYIDQFIFADNTPAFKNNAQIKEEELNNYLENVAEVLRENSDGYGIWTYRNYCANMLYNSQFALKGEGWEQAGQLLFEEEESSTVCVLRNGGFIKQIIPKIRNHFDSDVYTFQLDVVKLDRSGELFIRFGDESIVFEVAEEGKVDIEFKKNSVFDISIESNGFEGAIDNLKLYSQVQQGYLYDENNKELQCISGIRILNSNLK